MPTVMATTTVTAISGRRGENDARVGPVVVESVTARQVSGVHLLTGSTSSAVGDLDSHRSTVPFACWPNRLNAMSTTWHSPHPLGPAKGPKSTGRTFHDHQ